MNPLSLYFASGESLYVGVALLLIVLAASPLIENRWLLRLRNLIAWSALACIVMACDPFAWWFYGLFAAAFLLWFVGWDLPRFKNSRPSRFFRLVATPMLAFILLAMPAIELPRRRLPYIVGPGTGQSATPRTTNHLVVIGDSISSGINPQESPWPALVARDLAEQNITVTNLAQPGAQVSDALAQAHKVDPDAHLVFIEIGGNDLIANVPTNEFRSDLDSLLSCLQAPDRTLVMLELPLLPHKIGYGRAQRDLAAKYGVYLIPKRFFIEVLSGADATSDGLHLSESGAHQMAQLVQRVLSGVLTAPPATASKM